jgi:hypothetical protein
MTIYDLRLTQGGEKVASIVNHQLKPLTFADAFVSIDSVERMGDATS